jgi:predicted nucleic acid-binding protein
MITAIDTNVLIALWTGTAAAANALATRLDDAATRGPLVIAPAVYAELVAAPDRSVTFVDTFLADTQMRVDWLLSEAAWRNAAQAYRGYVARRRAQPHDPGPRRLLADFIIGAHALDVAATLLTLDDHLYRAAFPSLSVDTPDL